ncbi:halocyanin domain-containing protein [Halomicrobium salinisoli]|uniref:halocyanin domain-containing protein n=1 Tax=Halomicrobium salinisoli TaxID=2878391 RepID=UPI001CF03A93|nr:halocyanin domain-containing protein [Halomicrobium salinisoli]
MEPSSTRRRLLRSAGVAGVAALGGCVSGRGADSSDPTETAADGAATEQAGTATDQCEPSTEAEYTPAAELSPPESLEEWLADANGYGEPIRAAPPETEIVVGHPTDGGLAFDPPVVKIRPYTTVRWRWTGHGGPRNVVSLDGTFDSGRPNAQKNTGYHYVFTEPGEYAFVSEPQREEGMIGAVIVTNTLDTGNEDVDQWLYEVDNFDGTIADRTDADAPTVTVGAEGNGGNFAFDPPAIRVSTGATITWEWTGEGGAHDVVFEDADVGSGDVVADAGATFEHAFDEPGTYLYVCRPHEGIGMKGAVVVE